MIKNSFNSHHPIPPQPQQHQYQTPQFTPINKIQIQGHDHRRHHLPQGQRQHRHRHRQQRRHKMTSLNWINNSCNLIHNQHTRPPPPPNTTHTHTHTPFTHTPAIPAASPTSGTTIVRCNPLKNLWLRGPTAYPTLVAITKNKSLDPKPQQQQPIPPPLTYISTPPYTPTASFNQNPTPPHPTPPFPTPIL